MVFNDHTYEDALYFTINTTHLCSHKHTQFIFVWSRAHSGADVKETIGTLQAGSSRFQLEEMEHMSQAL